MPQLIEFKDKLIKVCPDDNAFLLKSNDRGRTWQTLFDGTVSMQIINDLACDQERILLDASRGFFISESGSEWISFENFKNTFNYKTK